MALLFHDCMAIYLFIDWRLGLLGNGRVKNNQLVVLLITHWAQAIKNIHLSTYHYMFLFDKARLHAMH